MTEHCLCFLKGRSSNLIRKDILGEDGSSKKRQKSCFRKIWKTFCWTFWKRRGVVAYLLQDKEEIFRSQKKPFNNSFFFIRRRNYSQNFYSEIERNSHLSSISSKFRNFMLSGYHPERKKTTMTVFMSSEWSKNSAPYFVSWWRGRSSSWLYWRSAVPGNVYECRNIKLAVSLPQGWIQEIKRM